MVRIRCFTPFFFAGIFASPAAAKPPPKEIIDADPTAAIEATYRLAFPRGFEIQIAARLARRIEYSQSDVELAAWGVSCQRARADGMESSGAMRDEEVVAPLSHACRSINGATERTEMLWEGRSRTGRPLREIRFHCSINDQLLFTTDISARNHPLGPTCAGWREIHTVVGVPGSSHRHLESFVTLLKAEKAEIKDAEREVIAAQSRREQRRIRMNEVGRGETVCLQEGQREDIAYLEDREGDRIQVRIFGWRYRGTVTPYQHQAIHWVNSADWARCP